MNIGDMTIPEVVKKYIGIGCVLFAIGFGYGQIRQTADSNSALAQTVKEINDKGTTGSRLALQAENGRLDRLDDRIAVLEKNYNEVNGKLSAIQGQLSVVAALLESGKKKDPVK